MYPVYFGFFRIASTVLPLHLQQTYGIADGTIQKALAILKAEGLVRAVRGRGVYVTSRA